MISEILLMEAAKPIISAFVKNVITPKIQSFSEKCQIAYNDLLIPRGEHFEEYLHRTYKKYSVINTLVFKNEQRLLKDLYLPLTLSKENSHNNEQERIRIEKYPQDLIVKYNKILIKDTAGMGKSTITKRLFLDVVENGYGIPIYIEMRRLSKDRSILLEIQEQINSLTRDFDTKLLLEFIQTGGFVIFLDGYDEIALEERSAVTANIQDFISKADNNTFILTSRPEQALASFGNFQSFTICPLNKKEAYELLRKYDSQGTTSKRLIEELKSGQYMIDEFLKNPLLVSLLFAAFDYKQTIPLKKHIFYRQVYDAYFDSHDLSKGDSYIHDKKSGLDIDDFERILRFIGFRCLKMQKLEFEKDVLLQIISDGKESCPDLNFTPSDYFSDMLCAVPLFCCDGHLYKWVHKSLQEYFAAQFIYKDAKENQDTILKTMYNSNNLERYINVLDIYADIDNLGFVKNIVKPMCEEYCQFYDGNINAELKVDICVQEDRIANIFWQDICILKYDKKNNESDADMFGNISTCAEAHLKKKINFITHHLGSSISIAIHREYKRCLLPLMCCKNYELFKKPVRNMSSYPLCIEEAKIYKIDVSTFADDEAIYKSLDQQLWKDTRFYYTLDYAACKKEIDKINTMLQNRNCVSAITDGL